MENNNGFFKIGDIVKLTKKVKTNDISNEELLQNTYLKVIGKYYDMYFIESLNGFSVDVETLVHEENLELIKRIKLPDSI